MPKSFYILVDSRTHVTVTTMPSRSMCQSVMVSLPPRDGYSIFKVPQKTKHLDYEFADLLSAQEIIDFYEGIEKPIGPEDWYPPSKKVSEK